MAGQLDAIGNNSVAAFRSIVRHMHIGHDPVVVAQPRYAYVLRGAGIKRDELAHHVAIADLQAGGLTIVFLVLRDASYRAVTVKRILAADSGVPIYDAMQIG